jgi:hypothetical protein
MAWLTPDAAEAFKALTVAVASIGGHIYLSDCYRSSLDQARAHADYLAGKRRVGDLAAFLNTHPGMAGYRPRPKQAFSPPPGGSFHEAGRAVDVDMDPRWLRIPQDVFWDCAHALGWSDIVGGHYGNPRLVDVTEEWHLNCLGPYQEEFEAIEDMKGGKAATRAIVARAIADIREGP